MGEPNVFEKLKEFIAGIAFRIFLWGIDMTQEVYWNSIYEQEQRQEVNRDTTTH